MKKKLSALLILMLLVLTGCSQPVKAKTDDDLIKETISKYNSLLAIALKSDPKLLKEVAIEREMGRVEIFMTQLADEQKIMDSKLQKLTYQSVEMLNQQAWQELIKQYRTEHKQDLRVPNEGALKMYQTGARVKTKEQWSYRYLDYKSKQAIGRPEAADYELTYILVKDNNKWKVADVQF